MANPSAIRPTLGRVLQLNTTSSIASVSRASQTAPFSTTTQLCQRKTRDNNKKRGVSSLYRSGPREPLSVSGMPLPKPRDFKPSVAVDEEHGLWGFFPAPGKAIWTPSETEKHGRGWTVEELRKKSWEDLHSLWWVCCRERNMLATSKQVLKREKLGFGDREIDDRDDEVRKTMRAIKHALTERYYTWQDAVEVASKDPEINLEGGEGEVYTPGTYEDEYEDWSKPTEASEPLKAEAAPVDGEIAKAEKEATR